MNSQNNETKKEDNLDIKNKIINETQLLIGKKSYSKVSIREIARSLNISPGTILYHFKRGKISILKAIVQKYLDELMGLKATFDQDFEDINEALRIFLLKNLDHHRNMGAFLTALEIELLSNSDYFFQYRGEFEIMMENYMKLIEILGKKLSGSKQVSKREVILIMNVIDTLVHRHVNFRNAFGSDEEFIDLQIKIIKAILTPNLES